MTTSERRKLYTNKAIRRIAELQIQVHQLNCTVDEYIKRTMAETEKQDNQHAKNEKETGE